ncbi:MAG: single-stranded DNA-binding protein [Candidatus Reddybacter sp.]
MSKDLNQCNFIGRLGRDPESRFMPSGGAVANFSIACGDDYRDKQTGQKVEQVNWISIVAFGRLAEVVGEYLRKGSKVYVSGKQVTRKWQDKATGADRYTTEIVANDLQMLDSRGAASGAGAEPTQGQAPAPAQAPAGQPAGQSGGFDNFDDDIPF